MIEIRKSLPLGWETVKNWLEGCMREFSRVIKNTSYLILPSSYNCRRRQWHPTPVLLPGKSHGWRSLVGCSPWGREESDTTEWLHFLFSLSFVGEGSGNPLQCSCLENPRDRGAWWAAVSGVAHSRTRLKWLSSSSTTVRNYQTEHLRFDYVIAYKVYCN